MVLRLCSSTNRLSDGRWFHAEKTKLNMISGASSGSSSITAVSPGLRYRIAEQAGIVELVGQ
jgi:hypothetical protein